MWHLRRTTISWRRMYSFAPSETASFYEESDGWYSFQAHTAGSRRRDTALMWTQQEITFVTLKNRLVLFVWHKTPSVYVCLCIFFDLAFRFWCDLGWIFLAIHRCHRLPSGFHTEGQLPFCQGKCRVHWSLCRHQSLSLASKVSSGKCSAICLAHSSLQ